MRRAILRILIALTFGLVLFAAGVVVILRADANRPDVIYIGDSMIANFRLTGVLPDNALDAGAGGETSGDVLYRWRALYNRPAWKSAIVWMGTNDIAAGETDTTFEENMKQLVFGLRNKGIHDVTIINIPSTRDVLPIIPLARVQTLNSWLKTYAASVNARFIETPMLENVDGYMLPQYMQVDGIHLNRDGYEILVKLITDH